MLFDTKAFAPTAVLLLPMVLAFNANEPIAVFAEPVVFEIPELIPRNNWPSVLNKLTWLLFTFSFRSVLSVVPIKWVETLVLLLPPSNQPLFVLLSAGINCT